jgi:hypothetical protein
MDRCWLYAVLVGVMCWGLFWAYVGYEALTALRSMAGLS